VQRLRELGWIENRNVAIEVRWAEGHGERYAEIAAEFVGLKADVIVTTGPAAPQEKRRHRSSRLFSPCQGTRWALAWLQV
jgi:putative ABC transport system substrate-binding protein